MANSCLFAVSLLAIIKISVGDLTNCNHIYPIIPPRGQPVAENVCRKIVDNTVVTWSKYICNATDKIKEEVYDNNYADCNGNLVSSIDVTSSIGPFKCDAQGSGTVTCDYVMRQQSCDADNELATYTIEPIITDVCIQYEVSGGARNKSFEWHCIDGVPWQTIYATRDGACSDTRSPQLYATDNCNYASGLTVEPKYCSTKLYGPTKAPTQEPTTEPTKIPTLEPTPYTINPSKAPTKAPSMMPSVMPTKTPSIAPSIFYSTETETTEAEHGSRIHIFGNLIFVSFIMIFISFVL